MSTETSPWEHFRRVGSTRSCCCYHIVRSAAAWEAAGATAAAVAAESALRTHDQACTFADSRRTGEASAGAGAEARLATLAEDADCDPAGTDSASAADRPVPAAGGEEAAARGSSARVECFVLASILVQRGHLLDPEDGSDSARPTISALCLAARKH